MESAAKKFIGLLLALAWAYAAPNGAPASGFVVCDDVKDPPTLDPFREFSNKNHTIIQQLMEGLVRFDPDGKFLPALAESWERIDPLRIRFHLRKNVKFHNGETFDAESVKFSLERYLDPSAGFPGRGFFSSVNRVELIDPHTVEIVTNHPDGILLYGLAGLITMVPPKYYQAAGSGGFAKKPIGTGPFKFVSWSEGKEIVLEANRDYWSAKQAPADRLIFRFIEGPQRLERLLSGDVDILTDVPGTGTYEIQKNPKTSVVKKESFFTVLGHFNTSRKPLSDKRVRRALNYAVDRKDLIRYDLFGNGRIIASVAMPGAVGYNPGLKPYPYDPQKAKRLLEEAGVKTPLRLKVLTSGEIERTASIIKKQLERNGVHLDIHVIANSETMEKMRTEEWDMGISGFPNVYAHIAFPLSILFYSRSPFSLLRSAEFDRKFEEASNTIDSGEQDEKFKDLDRYVYEEALGLFTYQKTDIYGMSRKVHYVPYITGMPYYSDTSFKAGP